MPTHNIDLTKQINELLEEYGDAVIEKIEDTLPYVANKTLEFFQSSDKVPSKTGDYRKGWRAKSWRETSNYRGVTVYNATDWQLTHLLENGHHKRDGTGWVDKREHIIYANEYAQDLLVKTIKKEIEDI